MLETMRREEGYAPYFLELLPPISPLGINFQAIQANTLIAPTPSLALLLLDLDQYPKHLRHTFAHILLSTNLNIARKWKCPTPPTLGEVIQTTHLHFIYKHTLALQNKNRDKILRQWHPWLLWFDSTPQISLPST